MWKLLGFRLKPAKYVLLGRLLLLFPGLHMSRLLRRRTPLGIRAVHLNLFFKIDLAASEAHAWLPDVLLLWGRPKKGAGELRARSAGAGLCGGGRLRFQIIRDAGLDRQRGRPRLTAVPADLMALGPWRRAGGMPSSRALLLPYRWLLLLRLL